jgi:hypothetical protein
MDQKKKKTETLFKIVNGGYDFEQTKKMKGVSAKRAANLKKMEKLEADDLDDEDDDDSGKPVAKPAAKKARKAAAPGTPASDKKAQNKAKDAGVTSFYNTKIASSKQPNVKEAIYEALVGPAYNLSLTPSMPFIVKFKTDNREGRLVTFRTVECIIPFPLIPLFGVGVDAQVAKSFVQKMCECIRNYEDKWWP